MRLSALRRNESGAVLTEFGLLIIPLCVLLLGLLDLGYMMYVRSTLQGVLNDVARQASVEAPGFTGEGTLEERIEARVKSRRGPMAADEATSVEATNYYEFSGVGKPEKLITDEDGDGRYDAGDDCWQDLNENGTYDFDTSRSGVGGADDIAVYQADMVRPRLFPMAGLLGFSPFYEISVRTVVRNQPYANQAVPPVEC